MQTQTHIVLNYAVFRSRFENSGVYLCLGGLLPDLAMFLFFFVERVLWGVPDSLLWSERYYSPEWQHLFHIGNSLPLMLLGAVIGFTFKNKNFAAVFVSAGFHIFCDFLLHADDAHMHFYPFSTWRFYSPISYWDIEHYALIVAPLEAVAYITAVIMVWREAPHWSLKGLMVAGGLSFAVIVTYFTQYF